MLKPIDPTQNYVGLGSLHNTIQVVEHVIKVDVGIKPSVKVLHKNIIANLL